jgi:hypothetical protein
MERHSLTTGTRRDVLWAGLAIPAAFALASSVGRAVRNWVPEAFDTDVKIPVGVRALCLLSALQGHLIA